MNSKLKIRLEAIEQAHRALDALPEHRPEELTKTEAIHRLIIPIRATRSKGYSLAAIGKVLSDCGIPITTGALRAYVSEAGAGKSGRRKDKAKREAKAAPRTLLGAAMSSQKAAPAKPTETASKPAGAGPARSVDLEWDAAERSDRAAPSPGVPSRQGFYIRPDTKDL